MSVFEKGKGLPLDERWCGDDQRSARGVGGFGECVLGEW